MAIDDYTEQLPPELKLDILLIHATERAALAGIRGQYPDSAVQQMIKYLEQARRVCDGVPNLLPPYSSRACTIVRIAQAALSARARYDAIELAARGGQEALSEIGNVALRQELELTSVAVQTLDGYRIR